MRDGLTRVFALSAALTLAVTAGVAWRVANPPWERIQRARLAAQIERARAEVEGERENFERSGAALDHRRAVADLDEARAAHGAAADERARLDAAIAAARQALDDQDRTVMALVPPSGPEHAEYVRLSGRAGVTEAELEAWLDRRQPPWRPALEARAGALAERARRAEELDDLEAQLDAIDAPLREAEEAVARFRAALERAEARLARLEATPRGVREIETPAGQVERCTTCHPGQEELATSHPTLGPDSPHQGWGCTTCHGGNGRALRVDDAHRFLTLRPWTVGGRYDLSPVIDALESPRKEERAAAADHLRRLTGQQFGFVYHAGEAERAVGVRAWRTWWLASRGYFVPPRPPGLRAADRDAAGRPLGYSGAGSCLRCHEATQRRHVERWQATKFTSYARLDEVEDGTPCLPCHTTGYDARSGEYVQEGVTCEECHGPGSGYGAAMEAGNRLRSMGAETEGDRLLDQVSTALREQMASGNVCVECHDPFGVKDLEYEHLM